MDHPFYMVFDCESVGLHGETFAVGWVVVREDGEEIASACYACDPAVARASDEAGRKRVAEHIPPIPENCRSPYAVRQEFWRAWMYAKERGAVLVADCPWPVEARFLRDCIMDGWPERQWQGPYPLIDVGSARLAVGLDPLATEPRLDSEKPQHHPAADARQSARLFLEALRLGRGE